MGRGEYILKGVFGVQVWIAYIKEGERGVRWGSVCISRVTRKCFISILSPVCLCRDARRHSYVISRGKLLPLGRYIVYTEYKVPTLAYAHTETLWLRIAGGKITSSIPASYSGALRSGSSLSHGRSFTSYISSSSFSSYFSVFFPEVFFSSYIHCY